MSLGIGTINPAYPLDVAGSASIQNNLIVGGGIIIADAIQVDTIHMGAGTQIVGNTDIKGDLNIAVNQTLTAGGDIMANSKLTVQGNATFNGALRSTILSGTGNSKLFADAQGNLFRGPSFPPTWECIGSTPNWNIRGNNYSGLVSGFPGLIDANIGTCDGYDFILKANNNYAQWIKTDGKIGFGIATPLEKFHFSGGKLRTDDELLIYPTFVNPAMQVLVPDGSGNFDQVFKIDNNGKTCIGFATTPVNTSVLNINAETNINAIEVFDGNATTYKIAATGKTQIGAGQFLSPNKLLTVNGDVLFANNGAGINQYNGYSGFEIVGNDRVPSRRGISVEDDPAGDLSFFINSNQSVGGPQFRFKNGNSTALTAGTIPDLFVINQNATTKINVYGAPSTGATPYIADALDIWNVIDGKSNFKVKSNGEAYARYMKVSVNAFLDYVFANTYKLPNLKEVEAYYKANHHLPEIPTATEVEKDGLDLGSINTLLVKKVEELTIYAVEQNKTTEAQQALLLELQKQIEALKKQINSK